MPYKNINSDPKVQAKMERCVTDVKKNNPGANPYAICYSSLFKTLKGNLKKKKKKKKK